MTFSRQWAEQTPSWSRVLFVEDKDIKREGVHCSIARSSLWTRNDYEARFDELLNDGYGWINMNFAGILDGSFLVIIELPHYKNSVPREKVSVNFSGPNIDPKTRKPRWNAADTIQIVDY